MQIKFSKQEKVLIEGSLKYPCIFSKFSEVDNSYLYKQIVKVLWVSVSQRVQLLETLIPRLPARGYLSPIKPRKPVPDLYRVNMVIYGD